MRSQDKPLPPKLETHRESHRYPQAETWDTHSRVLPVGAQADFHSEDERKLSCASDGGRGKGTILKLDQSILF